MYYNIVKGVDLKGVPYHLTCTNDLWPIFVSNTPVLRSTNNALYNDGINHFVKKDMAMNGRILSIYIAVNTCFSHNHSYLTLVLLRSVRASIEAPIERTGIPDCSCERELVLSTGRLISVPSPGPLYWFLPCEPPLHLRRSTLNLIS